MLWKLRLSPAELLKLALQLGSDLPLFVHGGTMLIEGRGEKVTVLSPAPHRAVVLLFPPLPLAEHKTAQMYAHLKPKDFTDGSVTRSLADAMRVGSTDLSGRLCNAFDSAALEFFTGLRRFRTAFRAAGAREIHVAGAGPTLYTIVRDRARAEKICQLLRSNGLDGQTAEF
jgi:4-diphosphocytidyl-2-C-methyl-D-erythritol kinase